MNNENENLDMLDILTIMSFAISMVNLEENKRQSEGISQILKEIQDHLHEQDEHLKKQDKLLERRNNNGD